MQASISKNRSKVSQDQPNSVPYKAHWKDLTMKNVLDWNCTFCVYYDVYIQEATLLFQC